MIRTVIVSFEGSGSRGHYSYLTDLNKLDVGDLVIVDAKFGFKTARIEEISDRTIKASKWVVQRVDLGKFIKKQAKRERIKEIEARLNEKVEEWKSTEAWRVMCNTDAEAKRLYEELKELGV